MASIIRPAGIGPRLVLGRKDCEWLDRLLQPALDAQGEDALDGEARDMLTLLRRKIYAVAYGESGE